MKEAASLPARKNPGIDFLEKWKTCSLRERRLFPAAKEPSKIKLGSSHSSVGHLNCFGEGQDAGIPTRFSYGTCGLGG
jgi:hypothetical protein